MILGLKTKYRFCNDSVKNIYLQDSGYYSAISFFCIGYLV